MNYLEMLRDRDDAIENELRGLLPDNFPDDQRQQVERRIHEAIEKGANFWAEKYLPEIVGDFKLAAKILAGLKEPVKS